MKKLIGLITAGIAGGVIALVGVLYMAPQVMTPVQQTTYAQQVNNSRVNEKPDRIAIAAPFDFKTPARKAMPVVVSIVASESETAARRRRNDRSSDPFGQFFGNPFGGPSMGSGSGVIISEEGYIVTNNHVVENADQVEVTLYDNRQFRAKVIGTDKSTDMAVLKIDARDLPTLTYADSDKAEIGEWVLAVGNPFDLTSTVTAGIISAKGRDIDLIQGEGSIEAFIQTDAAVNPGNSGGALVDAEGRLLGINTAIATSTGTFSGYSFAIPVNIMRKIVDDIIQYGSYQRAFLGINIMDMDSEMAIEMGLDFSQGVVIQSLIDGGAAQFSGLQPEDVIMKVNSQNIKTVPELQEIVGRAKVGDTIKVVVNRKGKTKEIPVRLKMRE